MASSEAIGKIVSQTGGVNASGPDGQSRPLEAGDEVFANEVINTTSDGVVIVEFADGSRKGMGSDNSISLDKSVFNPDAPPPSETPVETTADAAPVTTGAPEVVGSLSSASGSVMARGADGGERELEAGDQIYSNETVITGDNSLAIFEFSDGSRKGLTSNIELSMDESVYRSGVESPAEGTAVADAGAAELGDVIGTVNSLQGSLVAVAPDGSERTLDAGDEVFSGERLVTANDSAGIVELSDGSMRGFSGGSDITLSESMMQPVQAAADTQLADASAPTELGGVMGSVNSLQGTMTATAPDGSARTLDVGDEVFSGETVAIADGSAGIVELSDGSMRGFSGGSEVTLSESMMQPIQAAADTQLADASAPTELGGVIGNVNSLQGGLTAVAPDGSARTLDAGDEVFAGETLQMADGGAGIVELADGSMRGISGGSDLTLSDSMLRGAEGSEAGTQLAEGPAMTVGDVAGSMTSTSGTVTAVAPDGSERELGEGDEFFGGETLVVADGGAAIVQMSDGGVKGLSSGTELTLDGAVPVEVAPEAPVSETLLADAGDAVDAALEPIAESAPMEMAAEVVESPIAEAVEAAAPEIMEVAEAAVVEAPQITAEPIAELAAEPVAEAADVQSVLAAAQEVAAEAVAPAVEAVAPAVEVVEPVIEMAAAEIAEPVPVAEMAEPAQPESSAIGTVTSIGGDVKVVAADGAERSVDSGDEIFAGETVVTADGGTAILAMSDGSTKGVAGGSEITLDESMLRPAESTADTMVADAGAAAELGDVIGSVNSLQGTMTATAPDGSARTLDVGDEVFSGETVAIADGSAGIVELSDGSMRGFSGGSEVTLSESMMQPVQAAADTQLADASAPTELGGVMGSVNSLQGTMTATAPDGSARTLDVGDEVFSGETVAIADGSAGIVELSDGSMRGFSGGSEVTLSEAMMQPIQAAADTQLADASAPTELGGVIGSVNSLQGGLTAVAPDGSARTLDAGDEVFAGETLQMADGGAGIVELADGSMRGISGGSDLTLSDSMLRGAEGSEAGTQLAEGPAMTVGDVAGSMTSTSGTVKAVAPDGSERELGEGDEFFGGETLVVADGGAAIVQMSDGGVKGLSSGTELTLDGAVPVEVAPEAPVAETLLADAGDAVDAALEPIAESAPMEMAAEVVESPIAEAVEAAAPEVIEVAEAAVVEAAPVIEVAEAVVQEAPEAVAEVIAEPAVSAADVQSVLAAAQDAAAYEPAESARGIAESAEPMAEIATADMVEAAPIAEPTEPAEPEVEALGTITSIGGDVTVIAADGAERSVDSGDEIFAGETVVTADGGTAIIAMSDGSTKGVSGGSEITLDESMLRPADTAAETAVADAGSAAELGDVIGSVNSLQGSVTAVAPDGSERTLDTGDEVFSGETIVTADGSTGILELADGSMRGLSAGSEVALEEGMLRSAEPVADSMVADAGAVTELGDVIGSVNSLQGEMTATAPDGSARTLDVGDEVFAGETVTLADASAGIVELSDGSFRGFSGGSEVTLSESMMQPEAAAETQLADAGPTELGGVIGSVNSLEGGLTATAPDGSERELGGGDEVFAGETLQMADGSTGIIEMADGSMRGLSGGSELELSDSMTGGGQTGGETQLAEGPAMTVGDAVGGLSSVAGSVKAVGPDGSERELAEGDEMFGGETIVVADGSAAIVEFLDGSVKGLSSGSETMLEGGVPIEAEPAQAEEPAAAETMLAEAEAAVEQPAEEMATAEEAAPAAEGGAETVLAAAEASADAIPAELVAGQTPQAVPTGLMGGDADTTTLTLASHDVKVHLENMFSEDVHTVEITNFDPEQDTLMLKEILAAEGWDSSMGVITEDIENFMRYEFDGENTVISIGKMEGGEFVVDNTLIVDGVNLAEVAKAQQAEVQLARGAVENVESIPETEEAPGPETKETLVGNQLVSENEGRDEAVFIARSSQSTILAFDQGYETGDLAFGNRLAELLREGRFGGAANDIEDGSLLSSAGTGSSEAGPGLDAVLQTVRDILNSALDGVQNLSEEAIQAINDLIDGIDGFLNTGELDVLLDDVLGTLQNSGSAVVAELDGVLDGVIDGLEGTLPVSPVTDAAQGVLDLILTGADEQLLQGGIDTLEGGLDPAVTALSDGLDGILEQFGLGTGTAGNNSGEGEVAPETVDVVETGSDGTDAELQTALTETGQIVQGVGNALTAFEAAVASGDESAIANAQTTLDGALADLEGQDFSTLADSDVADDLTALVASVGTVVSTTTDNTDSGGGSSGSQGDTGTEASTTESVATTLTNLGAGLSSGDAETFGKAITDLGSTLDNSTDAASTAGDGADAILSGEDLATSTSDLLNTLLFTDVGAPSPDA